MLTLAMTMGFGVTGVMLYMFTYESQKQYAVLSSLGASTRTLIVMVLAQASVCALLGTGIGLGVYGIAGAVVVELGCPFRTMWFTPLIGFVGVLLVSGLAALVSMRPVVKLEPGWSSRVDERGCRSGLTVESSGAARPKKVGCAYPVVRWSRWRGGDACDCVGRDASWPDSLLWSDRGCDCALSHHRDSGRSR